MAEKKAQQIQIKIDDSTASGHYANLALVTHNENEFVLDFIFLQPAKKQAKVESRVILSPKQAKRLMSTLVDAVGNYEKRFGELTLPDQSDKLVH